MSDMIALPEVEAARDAARRALMPSAEDTAAMLAQLVMESGASQREARDAQATARAEILCRLRRAGVIGEDGTTLDAVSTKELVALISAEADAQKGESMLLRSYKLLTLTPGGQTTSRSIEDVLIELAGQETP